jgi:DNA polymerase I-like protein with 3'-5' exonuclease and polymerase domains
MKVLSLDTETSIQSDHWGADARCPDNDFYTVIMADKPDNVSICHELTGFSRQLPDPVCSNLEQMGKGDLIIGVNLGFDLRLMWNHNNELRDFFVRGGQVWDCQCAEYILTAQQHCFASLGELQEKYLGHKQKVDRISRLYQKKIGADKILQARTRCPRLFALYEKYCKLDGVTPLKIFKKQYIRAKKEGMLDIVMLYQDYLASLINMSSTGIHLDTEKIGELRIQYEKKYIEYLEKAQDKLKDVWTDERLPEFNVNSNDHKSAALFGGMIKNKIREHVGQYKNGKDKFKFVEYNIPVVGLGVDTKLTEESRKEGVYKTDTHVIERILHESNNNNAIEYCKYQKEAMSYKKTISTYLDGFERVAVDGVLYPNFNNCQTVTGRLSSSNPNNQNVSKRNKFGKDLHSLFIALPGWVCVQIDYSQLEIFVLAWLSNDKKLREDLLNGVDLHCVRLSYYVDKTYDELIQLCKVDADPYWVGLRTAAKIVSYQSAYGAMPKKISQSSGLDVETVETIFEKEKQNYSNAAQLGDTVRQTAERSKKLSYGQNIPYVMKKGKNGSRIDKNGVELLPIFDKAGNVVYNDNYVRMVGYWQSPTNKKYHFLENGRRLRNGDVSQGVSFTQTKNYPMQGSAADIQGATTAELLKACLTRPDKIKMINEVHDSKWFYIREDEKDVIIPWIVGVMEDIPKVFLRRFGIHVPFKFPVDVEIGEDFANMQEYKV